jgi:hypothetical protein
VSDNESQHARFDVIDKYSIEERSPMLGGSRTAKANIEKLHRLITENSSVAEMQANLRKTASEVVGASVNTGSDGDSDTETIIVEGPQTLENRRA